ncbi:cytokine receptor common subunit beta isoform X2 [Xyrauchen texanus]|uniref:cytokine receptor common subunit beta isoform X2 n=1 Tax=Xyrauchen texanus TaxID=154827 RepID=UPI002241F41E|nr:cytokine receptor common subunit beta isoform X2 [Xyrauchen texanus]
MSHLGLGLQLWILCSATMTLRPRNDILCISNGPGVLLSNGKVSHSCHYKTKRFSSGTSHILFFGVPCISKPTTFRVAQQGKVLTPIDLTEKLADGKGHLLSWRSPYPASSNITGTLVYQLQYRRYGNDWIVVDNINASKYMIERESLLPGYPYQAKVRARATVGLWSDWSSPVSWRTHSDGVFNLQCVIEGETIVTCSWQMKTELSPFMSYHVFCQDIDSSLGLTFVECCNNPLLKSSGPELSEFTCSVKTSNPSQLTMELRPVYYSRTFVVTENIQLPRPDPVKVEADGVVNITWSLPEVDEDLNFQIQLQIWTNKSSVLYNITRGQSRFEILSSSLQHSTQYLAYIRLQHIPDPDPDPEVNYVVLPSEWSQPTPFTNNRASWPISYTIYILTSVFVAVLFVILYNVLPACHRRIELWKGSIPSPLNSRVIEGMIKKSSTGWPDLQSEKEKTSACVLQATDDISICKNSVSGKPLLLYSEDMNLDTTTVKIRWSDGSNHFHSYVGDGMCQDKSGMSFTGPYILCCEDSSPKDKIFDVPSDGDGTCISGTSENSAPINGGYVMTPPTSKPDIQDSAPSKISPINFSDDPPEYTPSVDHGSMVLPHPSGYFMLPVGHDTGMGQSEPRGYVTLGKSGT